ncbi:hypothetical protein [Rhodanobacter fulvus]|nr:hypothetical protein [Rhodanobacter fulvus]
MTAMAIRLRVPRRRAPTSAARYYNGRPYGEMLLAKPNYSFEKRQRELAKKKQQEEKDERKRQAREAEKAAADTESKTSPDEN